MPLSDEALWGAAGGRTDYSKPAPRDDVNESRLPTVSLPLRQTALSPDHRTRRTQTDSFVQWRDLRRPTSSIVNTDAATIRMVALASRKAVACEPNDSCRTAATMTSVSAAIRIGRTATQRFYRDRNGIRCRRNHRNTWSHACPNCKSQFENFKWPRLCGLFQRAPCPANVVSLARLLVTHAAPQSNRTCRGRQRRAAWRRSRCRARGSASSRSATSGG